MRAVAQFFLAYTDNNERTYEARRSIERPSIDSNIKGPPDGRPVSQRLIWFYANCLEAARTLLVESCI